MARNISRIIIHATQQRVWKTLTRLELVKLWQFGSDLQTTWAVGDPIRFVAEWQGKVFEQWGTVLEYLPSIRLRCNLFAPRLGLEDKPENYFEMIHTLEANDGGTLLEIVHVDERPGAVQQAEQGEENPVLRALKDLAEKE